MTAPALVRQAAIDRAVRVAIKRGAKKVRVLPDGTIDILISGEQLAETDKISVEQTDRDSIVGPLDPRSTKAIF